MRKLTALTLSLALAVTAWAKAATFVINQSTTDPATIGNGWQVSEIVNGTTQLVFRVTPPTRGLSETNVVNVPVGTHTYIAQNVQVTVAGGVTNAVTSFPTAAVTSQVAPLTPITFNVQ